MQAALNFLPLAAFMLAYHYAGIYVATAVLMAAMVLLALVDYLRVRRVSPMHAVSTVLVLIFGSATLILHDPRFLKIKPTLLLWLMALAFLGSQLDRCHTTRAALARAGACARHQHLAPTVAARQSALGGGLPVAGLS